MPQRFTVFTMAVGLLLAATASAQVGYDYKPNTNFGRFKTYAFKDAGVSVSDSSAAKTTYDSPLVADRTRAAIAAQLERRGMTRDDNHPDVYVSTARTFKNEYTVWGPGWDPWPSWGYGYGYGWGRWYGYGGYGYGPWYTEETVVGTLTIDLEDAATGALLWRGVKSKDVHEHTKPAHRAEHINDEVEDILKKLPAGLPAR
jgi:hypothetical protein